MESLLIAAARRYGTNSPLRYPGGKSALAGLFADVISGLNVKSPVYVEPYAGGAGAGIALLREGIVDRLVINDIDPAVYAFWRSATERTDELVELVMSTSLTVEEWLRQREIYRAAGGDLLALGFAFFYLNRTNRSGVLNAGVIGGQDQTGNYKIDARFNRDTLRARLLTVGQLSHRIEVSDLDGRSAILRYADDPSHFLYIDPPYVGAGSRLYMNGFDVQDHHALATIVNEVTVANWIVTYDMSPLVEQLYAQHFQCSLELNYSARYPGRANELLIASPKVAKILGQVKPDEGVA